MKVNFFLLMAFSALVFACKQRGTKTADATETQIWVSPELADCMGVGPQKCLQIQAAIAGQSFDMRKWELWYDGIRGFEHQTGFLYKLLVRKETLANPPADASSVVYTFVRELEKRPMPVRSTEMPKAISLHGRKWLLQSVEGATDAEVRSLGSSERRPYLEISENGQLSGSGGCNRLTAGGVKTAGDKIGFGQVAATRMACLDAVSGKVESAFLRALEKTERFTLDGVTLRFFAGEKNLATLRAE